MPGEDALVREVVVHGNSIVEYKLDGPVAAVENRIRKLMARYYPKVYYTRVSRNVAVNGVMKAVVERARSCD